MKFPTIDTHIKLDINIAITVSVTIFILLSNNQVKEENKDAIEKIPKEIKNITRGDIIQILEKITIQGNNTKLTQDQILQYSKQILREVR